MFFSLYKKDIHIYNSKDNKLKNIYFTSIAIDIIFILFPPNT